MPTNNSRPPELRLIPGEKHRSFLVKGAKIVAAPGDDPPFTVDAIALEEDTYLVVSASTEIKPPKGHPLQIITDALQQQPIAPGSVLVREGKPLRLLTVIHDFNHEPSWQREWIATALDNLFSLIAERNIAAIAMPLFGHPNNLGTSLAAVNRLLTALDQRIPTTPVRIWLIVPSAFQRKVSEQLQTHCEN